MPIADAPLRHHLTQTLARWPAAGLPTGTARRAAVAVLVVEAGHGPDHEGMPQHDTWQRDAALLLTRRPSHMSRHAGQWAFPGGRMDPGETPEETALREMHEEVGLQLPASAVLGRLDDYATRSGFIITPVVVWGGDTVNFSPNPEEVASVHRIPVAELLRADAPLLDHPSFPRAGEHPVLLMPVGTNWIAAPTAAVLYQFREWFLCDRHTSVAHFDQPRFAWA
jgi:mutator protein MutT